MKPSSSLSQLLAMFSFFSMNKNCFFWACSLDFKQQLFIHENFSKIWERPTEILLNENRVDTWSQTILEEDLIRITPSFSQPSVNSLDNMMYLYYRIMLPNKEVRYITDCNFHLYDQQGNPTVVVGAGQVLDKRDWERLAKIQLDHGCVRNLATQGEDISQKILQFMRSMNTASRYTAHFVHGSYAITQREAECLSGLIHGKTAKEIARCYGLSYRTVEYYIENLKRKTNCTRTSELIGGINNKEDFLLII